MTDPLDPLVRARTRLDLLATRLGVGRAAEDPAPLEQADLLELDDIVHDAAEDLMCGSEVSP